MSAVRPWLDPAACPAERPPLSVMAARTRELHHAVDEHARAAGVRYLHPEGPTVQLDLLGSAAVVAWQEGKAERLFMGQACWSELPHLYARYGTGHGGALIAALRELEHAPAVVVTDTGMQATALAFDVLLGPRAHAVSMRQVYNKSRAYLEHVTSRLGGGVTIVDDGDLDAARAAIRPDTAVLFAETYTNPLMRAQDAAALGQLADAARATAPGLKLVIDSTIATPWGLKAPLLSVPGVDLVVGSGTKALGGQDRDLWGYCATRHVDVGNGLMDLLAMRGGILDWRRAEVIAAGLPRAAEDHARRCAGATRVAAFLAEHPRVEAVHHPSRPDHPDAEVIAAHYCRPGSIVSFRVAGADEAAARRLADALATTTVVRYALSFDGPTTKVNHHPTVSEYFTPPERLRQSGLDRLIRLGVGTEDPDDLCACLNWALHHGASLGDEELRAWQSARAASLAKEARGAGVR